MPSLEPWLWLVTSNDALFIEGTQQWCYRYHFDGTFHPWLRSLFFHESGCELSALHPLYTSNPNVTFVRNWTRKPFVYKRK